jgi:uncharacterized OsmC-like protein
MCSPSSFDLHLKGGTVTKEQAERAVSLSHTTYCSIT